MALELQSITERFIGAAITVHRDKGPGFLESIYENCLKIECQRQGVRVEFQKEVPIHYHNRLVGMHKLDALVENEIIVELKAVKALEDIHFAQVRSYLRATGLTHGLLLNFSTPTLTVKRVI